jgi:toluene monooxygenase system ferredoxin subunit
MGAGRWHAVADLDELSPGEIHPASAGGVDLILLRHDDGVAAYLDKCPHEGYPLSFGEVDGSVLICAKHLWEFDLRSGEHISRVRRPEHDLRKPAVRVVDGRVEVDVSELKAT